MSQEFIVAGNKIELCLVKHGRVSVKGGQPVLLSRFRQWTQQYVAQIAAPLYEGRPADLVLGDEYALTFYTPKGLYRCKAAVMEQGMGDGQTVAVRLASEMERYERRRFYRLPCILPMSYAVLTEEQKTRYMPTAANGQKKLWRERLGGEAAFHKATVLDISGGGMRFNSEVQQEAEATLLLCPELPKKVTEKVPLLFARVISSAPLPNRQEVYDNRVEYVAISAEERKELIYYIFQKENEGA